MAHISAKKKKNTRSGQVRSPELLIVDPTSEKFAITPELKFFTERFPFSGYQWRRQGGGALSCPPFSGVVRGAKGARAPPIAIRGPGPSIRVD